MTSVDVILLVPVAFYSVFMVLYLCEYMYLILLAARQSGDVTLMFSLSFLCLVIMTDRQSTRRTCAGTVRMSVCVYMDFFLHKDDECIDRSNL